MSKKTALILFLLALCPQLFCQNNESAARILLTKQLDSLLIAKVKTGEIPGAVIQIKKDGKIVYEQSYGYASEYDYNNKPLTSPEIMTTGHLFDIASLTKVVGTTTSLMLLCDWGKISVDDRVSEYIKAFRTKEKKNITLRQLLTHTSGLYEWYPLYYRASDKYQSYKLIGELPLMIQPGTQRRYSDLGFVILGEIIEIVSGMPLEKFEEQNIFIPLGMTNTTYNPLNKGFANIASTSHGNPYEKRMVYDSTMGYRYKEIVPESWNGWRNYNLRGEVNDGNTWYANNGISGAAGLFSTVDDLQKLVDMLVNRGKTASGQFISEKTLSLFLKKDNFKNGLGWMMDPENSFMKNSPEGSFGHTGFTGTSITVVPDEKLSVILLVNRQNTGLNSNGEYYNMSPLRTRIFYEVMKYSERISR
jgi:serine-type D-Ala-D-Ala carboxypeptidase